MKTLNIENLVERAEVTQALKDVAEELRTLAKGEVTTETKRKAVLLKGAIYCYSVLIRALKDADLDIISARLDALEKQRLMH